MSRTVITVALLLAVSARAEEPSPSPSPAPEVTAAEIERALREDTAAQSKTRANAPPPATPFAPADQAAAPTQNVQAQSRWGSVGRFIQSLNPDISAIIDLAAGDYSDPEHTRLSGDDPAATGFNAQEIELAFQAVVDPYFRADIFLTIPNLSGLEVEEAFVTTTHLPANFQIKAGVFRAPFGRQNTQHLHMQDFTRRPVINPTFLGTDGLRSPGAEVNWLVPRIPFYLLVGVAAFSVAPADPNQPLASFGGGNRWDFTYLGYAKAFFNLSQATSLYAGLSFASGNTSQSQSKPGSLPCQSQLPTANGTTPCDNFSDFLYGADVYLKWKPPNQAQSYASLAWQTEFFLRQIPDLVVNGAAHPQLEGGIYSQLVGQVARRWFIGLRGEINGLPTGAFVAREYAGALSLTCQLSEFARVRAYGEVRGPAHSEINGAAFLQLEASIGAHGAHPF
jgi:hypothetical protein